MRNDSCARASFAAAICSLFACGAAPQVEDASDDGLAILAQTADAVVPPTMLHLYDTSANGQPEIISTSGIVYSVNLEAAGAVGTVDDVGRAIMSVEGMSIRVHCSDGEQVHSDKPDRQTFRPSGGARVAARCTSGSARSAELVVERATNPDAAGRLPSSSSIGHDCYQHSGYPVALTASDGSVTRLFRTDDRTLTASFTNGTASAVRTSFSLGGQCPEGEKTVHSGSIVIAAGSSESVALECDGAVAAQPLFTSEGWSLD